MLPEAERIELLNLARFPGRFPGEHEVIADWLPGAVNFYQRIAFNVHLGLGAQPPADLIEPWRSQAIRGTQKRADIIAWLPEGVVIIEAKDRATSDALGQLFAYRALWLEGNPSIPVIALEVICRRVNDDDLLAFTASGVTVRIFEEKPA
jgi:hypothetical protein